MKTSFHNKNRISSAPVPPPDLAPRRSLPVKIRPRPGQIAIAAHTTRFHKLAHSHHGHAHPCKGGGKVKLHTSKPYRVRFQGFWPFVNFAQTKCLRGIPFSRNPLSGSVCQSRLVCSATLRRPLLNDDVIVGMPKTQQPLILVAIIGCGPERGGGQRCKLCRAALHSSESSLSR